jgi:hypothetical protein
MNPGEIVIWRTWLKAHEDLYTDYDYNIYLGQGEDPGPTFEQNVRDMWIKNTQFRADAVAYRNGVPVIFEVEDDCSIRAVGQIMAYKFMWVKEQRSAVEPKMAIVCRNFNANVLPMVRDAGIEFYQVAVGQAEMRQALGLTKFGGRPQP